MQRLISPLPASVQWCSSLEPRYRQQSLSPVRAAGMVPPSPSSLATILALAVPSGLSW